MSSTNYFQKLLGSKQFDQFLVLNADLIEGEGFADLCGHLEGKYVKQEQVCSHTMYVKIFCSSEQSTRTVGRHLMKTCIMFCNIL